MSRRTNSEDKVPDPENFSWSGTTIEIGKRIKKKNSNTADSLNRLSERIQQLGLKHSSTQQDGYVCACHKKKSQPVKRKSRKEKRKEEKGESKDEDNQDVVVEILDKEVSENQVGCQFVALADQLNNCPDYVDITPKDVQDKVIDWLKMNANYILYDPICDDDVLNIRQRIEFLYAEEEKPVSEEDDEEFSDPSTRIWQKYLKRLFLGELNGDQITLLAAAEIYKFPIHIVSSVNEHDDARARIVIEPKRSSPKKDARLYLSHLYCEAGDHFGSLYFATVQEPLFDENDDEIEPEQQVLLKKDGKVHYPKEKKNKKKDDDAEGDIDYNEKPPYYHTVYVRSRRDLVKMNHRFVEPAVSRLGWLISFIGYVGASIAFTVLAAVFSAVSNNLAGWILALVADALMTLDAIVFYSQFHSFSKLKLVKNRWGDRGVIINTRGDKDPPNPFDDARLGIFTCVAGEKIDMLKDNLEKAINATLPSRNKNCQVMICWFDDLVRRDPEDKTLYYKLPQTREEELQLPVDRSAYRFEPLPRDPAYFKAFFDMATKMGFKADKCTDGKYNYKEAKPVIFTKEDSQVRLMYVARNKWDNVEPKLKAGNINDSVNHPEILGFFDEVEESQQYFAIIDARFTVKEKLWDPLQHWFTYRRRENRYIHNKYLTFVQTPHWYEGIAPGDLLQFNDRQFFHGIVHARLASGLVPCAGTGAFYKFAHHRTEDNRFFLEDACSTEDCLGATKKFISGLYYSLFHDDVIMTGQAPTTPMGYTRRCRWTQGGLVVFNIVKKPLIYSPYLSMWEKAMLIQSFLSPLTSIPIAIVLVLAFLYISINVQFLQFESYAVLYVFAFKFVTSSSLQYFSLPGVDGADLMATKCYVIAGLGEKLTAVFNWKEGYSKYSTWVPSGAQAATLRGHLLEFFPVMLVIVFTTAGGLAIGDLLGKQFEAPASNFGRLGLAVLTIWFAFDGVILFLKDFKVYRKLNRLFLYTMLVLIWVFIIGTWATFLKQKENAEKKAAKIAEKSAEAKS